MYSVTVPVPGRARKLAADLHPSLVGFEDVREDHTCLLKRLGETDHVAPLQQRAHRTLEGTSAVDAEITHLDYFADPPLGTAPVVYLAVDSPGLERIHDELTDTFDPIAGLEGEDYVPHITLARGGTVEAAQRLADREIKPIEWTISELEFRNGEPGSVSRIRLS